MVLSTKMGTVNDLRTLVAEDRCYLMPSCFDALQAIGYSLAVYPLTLLATAMKAMIDSLCTMRHQSTMDLMDFGELKERGGFSDYYEISAQYSSTNRESG